ncbi:hypothetical protein DFH07DRAFT_795344 [Mycena maculata]|uniref:DUF4211 domain-containing protein n=1 Tax=Mycena maculata TaxID=230809 RepID=A0AAD7K549_9AGAR|nr:hypothetical protein DFH07DRAFT_795344 [Mycena maculata]
MPPKRKRNEGPVANTRARRLKVEVVILRPVWKRKQQDAGPFANTRARRGMKKEPVDQLESKGQDSGAFARRWNPGPGSNHIKPESENGHDLPPKPAVGRIIVAKRPAAPKQKQRTTVKRERSVVKQEPQSPPPLPQESEDESDWAPIVSPRRWGRNPVASDSEALEDAGDEDNDDPRTPTPRRTRRGQARELDHGFTSAIPTRKRLFRRRQQSSEADDLPVADSADVNDLALSPPPIPSKPTEKELKREAIEKLRNARKPGAPRKPERERFFVGLSEEEDMDTDDSSMGSEDASEQTDRSFIDDADQTADVVQAVEEALGPERYARRSLDQQFLVFIEYLVELHDDANLLSSDTLPEADRLSYGAALNALRLRTEAFADSMLISTWSGPFTATLQKRPVLVGPVGCEGMHCQACWTRGPMSCSTTGSYSLSTRKGFYDRDTYQDILERHVDYGKETMHDFDNSTEADRLLYPPGFRLVIGARCSHRAVAYHQARHYLYNIAVRVRDEIERVCDLKPRLVDNKQALVAALSGQFATELWHDFEMDSAQWKNFQLSRPVAVPAPELPSSVLSDAAPSHYCPRPVYGVTPALPAPSVPTSTRSVATFESFDADAFDLSDNKALERLNRRELRALYSKYDVDTARSNADLVNNLQTYYQVTERRAARPPAAPSAPYSPSYHSMHPTAMYDPLRPS